MTYTLPFLRQKAFNQLRMQSKGNFSFLDIAGDSYTYDHGYVRAFPSWNSPDMLNTRVMESKAKQVETRD